MAEPKFYMQRVDITGQPIKDLEADFPGLRYKEFKGLENYGKIKSVYTEEFAETDRLQVYMTEEPIRETISPTLTLVFIGDGRRESYHNFVNYISKGEIIYWDNVRNRRITFVLIEAIEPENDTVKGTEYIQVSFKLQCLNGQAITYK